MPDSETTPATDSPAFRSFWDRAYADGDHLDHWEPPRVPAELAGLVAAGAIPTDRPVLDLGCGSGREAVFLAAHGAPVIGVDSSREAVELARRRAGDAGVAVDFRCASVFELPLADGAVGFAVDRGCFHALDPEDRPLYAAEVARVLAPGAGLLLRGAADTAEDEGLWAVDADAVERYFAEHFTAGPVVPVPLDAGTDTLEGHMVLLTRRR